MSIKRVRGCCPRRPLYQFVTPEGAQTRYDSSLDTDSRGKEAMCHSIPQRSSGTDQEKFYCHIQQTMISDSVTQILLS